MVDIGIGDPTKLSMVISVSTRGEIGKTKGVISSPLRQRLADTRLDHAVVLSLWCLPALRF
jgi:hypothetical protein